MVGGLLRAPAALLTLKLYTSSRHSLLNPTSFPRLPQPTLSKLLSETRAMIFDGRVVDEVARIERGFEGNLIKFRDWVQGFETLDVRFHFYGAEHPS
jgi:hypothetical protein